ncbi:unnamed protein product [Strongylus vulgaris]|uniref:SXP/RAL-2 family protein Ani s 5-like cation-binding domain-containing protein n=1 Tax=Strongylus vulgaris TaxID=40348 RepID=A0A3P7JM50_STRVU|nr:unnamed protein product [Strongylus vulgaris]
MTTLFIALVIVGVVLCREEDIHHGKQAPHRPAPPPFLRNVSAEARRNYYNILKKKNETIAQQKEEIRTWAETYGVKDQVEKFEANLTKHKMELQANVTELINKLPDLYKELVRVYNDEEQTPLQMKDALDKFKLESRKVRLVWD